MDNHDVGCAEAHIKRNKKVKRRPLDERYIECIQRWFTSITIDHNFRPYQANTVPHIDQHGRHYQGKHPNGNVLFRSTDRTVLAGQIDFIFSYLSQTFAILNALNPLPVNTNDFTGNLPQAASYLTSAGLEPDPIVVHFDDIIGHFASIPVNILGIEQPLLHVLPCNRTHLISQFFLGWAYVNRCNTTKQSESHRSVSFRKI